MTARQQGAAMETRDNRNPKPERATRRWFDDFTVELRLLDVPGDAIGDALASAREFLADSGGTPAEVFGDPHEYAQSLDLPREPVSRGDWAKVLVPACLGMLGFFAVAAAVSSSDASIDITVSGFLLIVTALALAACAPALLTFILRRPMWQTVLAGGCFGVFQVLVALLAKDVVLFALPAVPTALLGGALLLSTSLWGQFRKGVTDDPVVEPLSARPRSSFGDTLFAVLGNWMLFLVAAAVAAWFLLRP